MTNNISDAVPASAADLVISRTFRAPIQVVFDAWTMPEHLVRWYAPEGCRLDIVEFNFRVGGRLHTCIETSDGYQCWIAGSFTEIDSPRRFAYVTTFSDASGARRTPREVGRDDTWPNEVTTAVEFETQGGGTLVTIRQTVAEDLAKQTGAYPSWLSMLDRLDDLLATSA